MPTISSFFNIKIHMYWNEHNPPHIHAFYKTHKAVFNFDGDVTKGFLPRRERLAVQTWIEYHQEELAENWRRAEKGEDLCEIEPLQL